MTPFEKVLQHYTFPPYIVPKPLQIETINELAPLPNSGEWLDMGTGKTFCSTACSLFHKIEYGHQTIVVMPPVLVPQWAKWLRSITPALRVTEYVGTPTQRAKLSLDADFVLVGVQIFKRDIERFTRHFAGRPKTVTVDEATIICNIGSANHQTVYDFSIGNHQILLSGTPANNPMDAYGLIKFTAPGTYRNKKQFENIHVESRDFYDRPNKFKELDLLYANLARNSKRILYEDMYKDIEQPLYSPIDYDLDPAHYKLYRRLAEEELLKLPDGGKIDGTTANKLRHALGQIVVNWEHFSGVSGNVSNAIHLVEEKLEELGTGKLVVFADYKLTVRACMKHLKKYGVVSVNSEVSNTEKQDNIARFINDPKCRVIVIQFKSGGYGLDGLQHVCNHMLFLEPCLQPRDFHQCVARLKRTGQTKRVMVMMAIARGTTQPRGFKILLENDTLVNQVIRTAGELREMIYGG